MIEIDGKKYELVELSARRYQELMDRLEKDFGAGWQQKGGIAVGVTMLQECLKAEDGSKPTVDTLWDQPIKVINRLSKESMILNGLSDGAQEKLEKN